MSNESRASTLGGEPFSAQNSDILCNTCLLVAQPMLLPHHNCHSTLQRLQQSNHAGPIACVAPVYYLGESAQVQSQGSLARMLDLKDPSFLHAGRDEVEGE